MSVKDFLENKTPSATIAKIAIAFVLLAIVFGRGIMHFAKDAFTPNVTFSQEEMAGNRTEHTEPLGIYDLEFIERSSGKYLTGKIRKNSTVPEQSYITLDVEFYDSKGRPVSSRIIDSVETKSHNNTQLLAFGDVYEFEIRVTSSEVTQFKIMDTRELSLSDHLAVLLEDVEDDIDYGDYNSARDTLDKVLAADPGNATAEILLEELAIKELEQAWAEEEAEKQEQIQRLLEKGFSGETACKILKIDEGDYYSYRYGDFSNDSKGNYYPVSYWSESFGYWDTYKVYEDGTYEYMNVSEEDAQKHTVATFAAEVDEPESTAVVAVPETSNQDENHEIDSTDTITDTQETVNTEDNHETNSADTPTEESIESDKTQADPEVNLDELYASDPEYLRAYLSMKNIEIHKFSGMNKIEEQYHVLMNSETTPEVHFLEEVSKLFQEDYYKKTVDYSSVYYVGNLKDNMPDGFGIMLTTVEDVPCVMYAGEFKKGMFDGLGMIYNVPNSFSSELSYYKYDTSTINFALIIPRLNYCFYQGEFKEGEYHGKGNKFDYPLIPVDEESAKEWTNKDISIEVAEYKKGVVDGKYKIYIQGILYEEGEVNPTLFGNSGNITRYFLGTNQIQYKGGIKNDEYDGQGTLYNSDGEIIYSGKWEKGDVASK